MGRLSPLGRNGGLSAQRPDQGEGSETSTSAEAPVDWECALRSMSEGTGAAGDSGSSCSRNYGSLSQRRHVPEPKASKRAAANWVSHTTSGEAWYQLTPRSIQSLSFPRKQIFLILTEAEPFSRHCQGHTGTSTSASESQLSVLLPPQAANL